ncbi:MAG TPA: hypothetical protein VLD37_05620 [Candidatus Bilamarchaeum sp.]|nr:hypothetical protein [Candidatus Bilamarchaeum sp.]
MATSKFSKLKEAASKKKAEKSGTKAPEPAPKAAPSQKPSEAEPKKPEPAQRAPPKAAAEPRKEERPPVVRKEPEKPAPVRKSAVIKRRASEIPTDLAPEDLPVLPPELPKKAIPPPPIIIPPPPPPPPVYKAGKGEEKMLSAEIKKALDERMRKINELAKAQLEAAKAARKK